jgi:hypothetical protein
MPNTTNHMSDTDDPGTVVDEQIEDALNEDEDLAERKRAHRVSGKSVARRTNRSIRRRRRDLL